MYSNVTKGMSEITALKHENKDLLNKTTIKRNCKKLFVKVRIINSDLLKQQFQKIWSKQIHKTCAKSG